jgi:hypothetical protein
VSDDAEIADVPLIHAKRGERPGSDFTVGGQGTVGAWLRLGS